MKLLHERVKEAVAAAKKNKVSVLAIAKACGISRQAVYQWMEEGANSIDGANLVELAELSGYNARWIANGRGPKTNRLSSDEVTIIEGFRLLDDEMREEALMVARRRIEKAKSQQMNAA